MDAVTVRGLKKSYDGFPAGRRSTVLLTTHYIDEADRRFFLIFIFILLGSSIWILKRRML